MKYANVITGKQTNELPTVKIESDGTPILGATFKNYIKDGWREVVETDKAEAGNRILAYKPQAIDDKTCKLVAVSVVSIAEESAKLEAETIAHEAEAIAWQEQAKLVDADFTTWSRHERFLLSLITKIAPDLDLTKEYESLK